MDTAKEPESPITDACSDFKEKIQTISEQTTELSIKEVATMMKGALVLEQRTHRNHSFQLVQLQNEMTRIRQERENETKELNALRDHVLVLFKELADAKGLIGRLRIDCHSRGHTSKATASRSIDTADTSHIRAESVVPPTVNTEIVARLREEENVEVLADTLLQEQRPKLVDGLVALQNALDKLSVSHKRRGKSKTSNGKKDGEDNKENVPPVAYQD